MNGLIGDVRKWLRDDEGVTAVEYVVMLTLIIVVLIGTINSLGGTALDISENNSAQITGAVGGS